MNLPLPLLQLLPMLWPPQWLAATPLQPPLSLQFFLKPPTQYEPPHYSLPLFDYPATSRKGCTSPLHNNGNSKPLRTNQALRQELPTQKFNPFPTDTPGQWRASPSSLAPQNDPIAIPMPE
ncbi:hypothetical protein SUGI_0822250 [Cryptomeria japonica]|nr:hypothetical protein SUGI_0822250 [Cryptomeria japonica]